LKEKSEFLLESVKGAELKMYLAVYVFVKECVIVINLVSIETKFTIQSIVAHSLTQNLTRQVLTNLISQKMG
jgi:hypothetical protein